MSEAKLDHMLHWICRWFLDLDELTQLLADVLDEAEITETDPAVRNEVYGSDAQIAVLRRIGEAVRADWEAEPMQETLAAVDIAVYDAGEGPVFFNAVLLVYRHWEREWNVWHESHESGSGSSVAGSDDEAEAEADEAEVVRRVGRRRVNPWRREAEMRALLAALRQGVL